MLQSYRLGLLHCSIGLVLMLASQPILGHTADFVLKWNSNNEHDLLGYYLYYQEGVSVTAMGAGATKMNIALNTPGFDADQPTYTITGLKNETLYYFAVSAYNAAGESALSDEVFLSKGPGDEVNTSGAGNTGSSGDSSGCFINTAQ